MIKRSLLPLCCLLLFPLSSLASGVSGGSGIIHFVGSIVEDGCDVQHHKQVVEFNCPVGSKWVKQPVAMADLNSTHLASNVPANVKFNYLDAKKKLAVLSISYQ